MDSDLTILIIEPNENDARLLEMAFRAIGKQTPVRMVEDGDAAAIEYLSGSGKYEDRAAFPFPNVLDLKMPKISGFDVLRWLKGHPDCAVMPTMVFSGSNTNPWRPKHKKGPVESAQFERTVYGERNTGLWGESTRRRRRSYPCRLLTRVAEFVHGGWWTV